jgi:DNA replication and repair protein RecF
VPIERFTAENFRCLESVALDLDPEYNLIFGANASGKTSLLEALSYLGRGKSFRGASTSDLIRHGEKDFVLFGRVEVDGRRASVGARNGRDGLEIRVDGDSDGGAAALAAALPLQVIDPAVHDLVSGGPDQRRRYLDWIAFHVEPDYLSLWRRFRRTLKQRNAALRSGNPGGAIKGWDIEFVDLSGQLDAARRRALDVACENLEAAGADLLGGEVRFEYRPGWNKEKGLLGSLEEALERELQVGSTQYGPHRGDLKLIYDDRQARKLVSRGQQKLLACAMVLAATETAQTSLERPLLLLLDDPAAELDQNSLGRLMRRVGGLGCQVVATSLASDSLDLPGSAAVFHVEQGCLNRVT